MARGNFKSVYEQNLQDSKEWNFAVGYFNILIERIKVVDELAIDNNLVGWYRALKALWRDTRDIIRKRIFDYRKKKQEEKDSLWKALNDDINGQFDLILKALTTDAPRNDPGVANKLREFQNQKAEIMLDKLNSQIYSYIHESGIILPPKWDFDWEMEEDQAYPE